ncbi:MAG: aminoacyl-histidine dipeptidase [Candidatus Hodarchaeales archaeon]
MTRILKNLEPKLVWEIFEDISRVPRPSKKEAKIREWIKGWAKRNNLPVFEDQVGNILLRQDASKGYEKYPGIVLQGHVDMVCQKSPESNHDFNNDPIPLKIVDDYVTAEGTTLGADNGIGVAMALAVLVDETVQHGPIDVLLTVDEETGLTGAFALKPKFIRYKYLINLDSEDEGEITTGSAGGGDTQIILKTNFVGTKGEGIELSITGLKGGHSGIDIHLPRLNAIKVMAELVNTINKSIPIKISSIYGGSAHNAIPRDCTAWIIVDKEAGEKIDSIIEEWKNKNDDYFEKEPNLEVKYKKIMIDTYMEKGLGIIKLLGEIPHGPLTFSKTIQGLVETSNNLALVKTEKREVRIFCSTRSSKDEELEKVRKSLKKLGKKFQASIKQGSAYPGWNPDISSPLIQLVKREYERYYGKEVKLSAIHAGLECGLFKGLDPELQIVSFGPEIKDGHSPDERVYINSVKLIWQVLKSVLERSNELQ